MSACGTEQTSMPTLSMSVLEGKADIRSEHPGYSRSNNARKLVNERVAASVARGKRFRAIAIH